jgi:iron complex transport system ATP-binding protein
MTTTSTRVQVISDNLLIQFSPSQRVLSSAFFGGGFCDASFILNHYVREDKFVDREDLRSEFINQPESYIRNQALQLGLTGRGVGLMTAVNISKKLVALRQDFKDLWVEGFFTVGIGNPVRAGDPATYMEKENDRPVGTINLILVTSPNLSDSAMVDAIQVATEAKTAILVESGVKSAVSSRPMTGTGTDCTVIVSGHGRPLRYSGTHTKMGELIGRVVSEGIMEGLKKCTTV